MHKTKNKIEILVRTSILNLVIANKERYTSALILGSESSSLKIEESASSNQPSQSQNYGKRTRPFGDRLVESGLELYFQSEPHARVGGKIADTGKAFATLCRFFQPILG